MDTKVKRIPGMKTHGLNVYHPLLQRILWIARIEVESEDAEMVALFLELLDEALKDFTGTSVAQWSEHSPFISEVAGSILSENVLNVTRTQCSIHVKRVSQCSAENRGFSPGAPVSSNREGWQGGLGYHR